MHIDISIDDALTTLTVGRARVDLSHVSPHARQYLLEELARVCDQAERDADTQANDSYAEGHEEGAREQRERTDSAINRAIKILEDID